jgi:hypothetical protein
MDVLEKTLSDENYTKMEEDARTSVLLNGSSETSAIKARIVQSMRDGTEDFDPVTEDITDQYITDNYIIFITDDDDKTLDELAFKKMCHGPRGRSLPSRTDV